MGVGLFLFVIVLVVGFFFFIIHGVFVFGLINVEPDFTHTVLVADLLNGGFDDDVIFIDGNIFHVVERYSEHFIVGHGEELELLSSDVEFSEMDSLE